MKDSRKLISRELIHIWAYSVFFITCTKTSHAASPTIDYQPKGQTVILFQPAAFGVIASPYSPGLSYQWRKDGVPIPGATNDQIILAKPRFSDAGLYSVVVSNSEGTDFSKDAILKVTYPGSGNLDYSFPRGGFINGAVSAIALQSDGKILIGGGFDFVNGEARSRIARLNPDGTVDFSFMNGTFGANNWVNSILVQNDRKVIIAGDFTVVNGVERARVARLNPDGTLDLSFQNGMDGANNFIWCAAMQSDGKILIGGSFGTVNGVNRNGIARLNTDGSLDTDFQDGFEAVQIYRGEGGGGIFAITLQQDGKVVVGGRFSLDPIEGVPGRKNHVARLNPDGSLDKGFATEIYGGRVSSVMIQNDAKILIGGTFTIINGIDRTNIARLNGDGTLDDTFVSTIDFPVFSAALQNDGKLVVDGPTRLNSDGTFDESFRADFYDPSQVLCMASLPDRRLMIGGYGLLVRLGPDGSFEKDFQKFEGPVVGRVRSIAVQPDDKIVLGGPFFMPNISNYFGIVRLNPGGEIDPSFIPQKISGRLAGGGSIYSIKVQQDGKLIIAGEFGEVGSVKRSSIARLNPDGIVDRSFLEGLSGVDGYVWDIVIQPDEKVVLGGDFATVNSVHRNCIARLNADGTIDTTFQADANLRVSSMAPQPDGKILIGGYFTTINGMSRTQLARLNSDGTLDSGFQCVLSNICCAAVDSLAVLSDGKVLIGGNFGAVNGSPTPQGLARLNLNGTLDASLESWLPTYSSRWKLDSGATAVPIALQNDGKVLLGGEGIVRFWGNSDIPPEIKTLIQTGPDINLSWYAISNRTYRVQYSDTLSAVTWVDLPGDVSATASIASKTDPSPDPVTRRFYRVMLLP